MSSPPNTGACGKVAVYDGSNTIIMAHMTGLLAASESSCVGGCLYDATDSTTSRVVALPAGTSFRRVRAGNSGRGGHWSGIRWLNKI